MKTAKNEAHGFSPPENGSPSYFDATAEGVINQDLANFSFGENWIKVPPD